MAYDIFDGLLYRWAGLKGIVLAAGALIALSATTLMPPHRRRGSASFRGVAGDAVFRRLGLHALPGPGRTYLLAPASIFDGNRRSRPPRLKTRAHLVAVPIALVWMNLHGGFLVLIGLLGFGGIRAATEPGFRNRAAGVRIGILRCAGLEWTAAADGSPL